MRFTESKHTDKLPRVGRRGQVLIVDDEPGLREMLSILFRREGYDVTVAPGFKAAKEAIENTPSPYGVVLTDLMMPDGSGLDVLSLAKQRSEVTEVIVMTAHGALDNAVEAMKRGAYDFVTKPFATPELRALAAKAFEKRELATENVRLRAQVARQAPKDLLGHSRAMQQVLDVVKRVAAGRSTVLITGESGTGKERIARLLHDLSDRKDKPFLVVNCGAIPETLVESELFGHEKGAFTGAATRSLGIFRTADGGTVFLDEVGELPAPMQVKLLRVLQERKVRGVGETEESSIDVRVLAATNRQVEEDVKAGTFRQDLYYRLNVIRLALPPLRDRREDVPELARHFLERCSHEHGKEVRNFSPDALRALDAYDFPGNVRELENIVERAVALASGPLIGLGDLPHEVVGGTAQPTPVLTGLLPEEGVNIDDVLGEVERRFILQALERSGGVRTGAARLLGITLRSLRYRMQKHAMQDVDDGPVSSDSAPPESM
jgi:two-component system, NtrC family, response regulator PilR